jgi:hypothetical protein
MTEERGRTQSEGSQPVEAEPRDDGFRVESSPPDTVRPESQRVRVPRAGAPPPDALRAEPPRREPQTQPLRGADLNYHEVVQSQRAGGHYVRIPRTVGGFRRRGAGTIEATPGR